ncbi:MAG: hypothetical protein KF712_08410 [Akkermansiaceae bacterium]|nr:hypothetical protein [Akkermansiaceae bacterium]
MPDDTENLISTVVRGIPDLELRLAADRELRGCLREQGQGIIRQVMDRFNEVDHHPSKTPWRWILAGLVVLVSIAVAIPHALNIYGYRQLVNGTIWINYEKSQARALEKLKEQPWSQQDRILLFGPLSNVSIDQRLETFRRMASSDPVFLAEYVTVHSNEKGSLPADLESLAAEFDPDNSLYDYLRAAREARDIVKEIPRTRAEIKAGKSVAWKINDEAKLAEAIRLMMQGSRKPDFRSRVGEMSEARMGLLPWSTREERFYSGFFVFPGFTTFQLNGLGQAVSAEAERLAATGDRKAFLELATAVEIMIRQRLADNDPTILGAIILQTEITRISGQMETAAGVLGLEEEAARFREVNRRLEDRREFISQREKTRDLRGPLAIRLPIGQHLIEFSHFRAKEPPDIRLGELLPGTYADHAFFSRALCFGIWTLSGLCAGLLLLHRAIASRTVRLIGTRMSRLVGWKDLAIIAGISCVLPTLYVLAFSRLTPLGAREYNLTGTYYLLPTAHFIDLFLAMVALTVLTTRWRLHRLGRVFGLGQSRTSWIGWLCLLGILLHIPLVGWWVEAQRFGKTAACMMALPVIACVIWLLVIFFRGPFGTMTDRVNGATMVRILIPMFGMAMIWAMALMQVFKAEDDHWTAQDRFLIDARDPGYKFTYERTLALRLNEELREALGHE